MEFEMNEIWNINREDIVPIDKYEVIYVSQSCEGTRGILEGNKNSIEIIFWAVDTFRLTDEGRRLRTYNEVENVQEYHKDFVGRPLYTVENSELVEWVTKESDVV